MPVTREARRQTRAGRFYDIDGFGSLPSVTTVLSVIAKPALLNWMAKTEREMVLEVSADLYEATHGTPNMSRTAWLTTMETRLGKAKAGSRELAKAGEIGSHAHQMIEWDLHRRLGHDPGPKPVIVDKALWSFMSFEDWAKAVNLKPLLIEEVVYSETYGYAGTMDLYAEIDHRGSRRRAVIDFKTGKAVYPEAYLQNSSYAQALREMGHGDPEMGLIVRLPKVDTDPEFEAVVCPEEADSLPVFLNFLAGWKWAQQMDEEYQAKKESAKEKAPPKHDGTPLEQPPASETPAAPLPRAVIPPWKLGEGPVESVEFGESKGRKYAKLVQSGYTLYVTDNAALPIDGGKKVFIFDMLKVAKGSECRFSVVKKKTKGGMSYKVVGTSQIGLFRWDEEGNPIVAAEEEKALF